jgi:murein DD-endopeptidase MepM/ murein hydrolase activator NlpD
MKFSYLGENITSIEIFKDNLNSLLIDISNEIKIKKVKKDVELIQSYKSGVIQSSFYEAALMADIPDSIIMDFAYIFGWDIDFVFDIREGDSFYVVYETPYSDGAAVKNGDIILAKFINNGKTYSANRFFVNEKKKEFFDNEGNNLQKAFLRAPLDFAYISSHFNPNRMHPVLHKIRAHNGVDYAASSGSPVRTTGNGTVYFAGRRNGCGNEIVIKHSNDYSTRYCHLSKFKENLKKGKKVIQGETIGYVGSTGLATGPHLHYEFKIGNKHVDPVKLELPSAEPISKKFKSDFDTLLNDNKLMLFKLESLNPIKNE